MESSWDRLNDQCVVLSGARGLFVSPSFLRRQAKTAKPEISKNLDLGSRTLGCRH